MSYLDVYIGEPVDPNHNSDHNDRKANIPKRISPFFIGAFDIVKDKIERGEYSGKQTDWGSWTGIVNKKEIKKLLNLLYKDYQKKHVDLPHIVKQIDELIEFVKKLDDKKTYYIVACEL